MSEWYYQSKKSEQVGPVTGKVLLDKVRSGEVKPETLIRKGDSQWVPADEVGDLFAKAFDSQQEHHCPFCGKTCMPPPTTCTHCYRKVPVSDEQREAKREATRKQVVAQRRERERNRQRAIAGDEMEEPVEDTRPEPTTRMGKLWRKFTDTLSVMFERAKD